MANEIVHDIITSDYSGPFVAIYLSVTCTQLKANNAEAIVQGKSGNLSLPRQRLKITEHKCHFYYLPLLIALKLGWLGKSYDNSDQTASQEEQGKNGLDYARSLITITQTFLLNIFVVLLMPVL